MVRLIILVCLITVGSCFLIENVLHLEVTCANYNDKCDHNILEFLFEVCGTDGVTYPNSCELAKAHCPPANQQEVHIDHIGKCKGSDNHVTQAPTSAPATGGPILDTLCLQLSREECSPTRDEVCGSDGRTYANYCEFQKAACMHKTLTVTSFGFCP